MHAGLGFIIYWINAFLNSASTAHQQRINSALIVLAFYPKDREDFSDTCNGFLSLYGKIL
jgi:hypothetical protein